MSSLLSAFIPSVPEQIAATGKSQLESQLNFLTGVVAKTVDGAQQVVALNLHTARTAAERATAATRQLAEARDPREVLNVVRPLSALEGALAYGRELFSIASNTHVQLLQVARDGFRAPALPTAAAPTLTLAAPAVAETIEAAAEPVFALAEPVAEAAVDSAQQVTEAIEQSAAAVAETAPAAATSELLDGEPAAAPKAARTRPAVKPVAEAVAKLADKPSTTLKSISPGKPRKS